MTNRSDPLFGFLNIDKPSGMTSHDVVARVRRAVNLKQVGHAGTLDPLATGVLILCVGAATRLSEYVMHSTKRYHAWVRLGVTTITYDAEGEIVRERDASHVSREDVEHALGAFLGEIDQIPPMYSAIKQGGRKLYDLAREGKTVEREARKVHIHAMTVQDWNVPDASAASDRKIIEFTLDVTCSAGTYIRSLAFDIGEALEVGAHLVGLRRTASGVFTLENAVPLDTLLVNPARYLIQPSDALKEYPSVTVDADAEAEIRYGRTIAISGDLADGTIVMAYGADTGDRLIAVLQADDGRLKPQKVFV